MIKQIRRIWKGVLLTLLVDNQWYRDRYPDVRAARMAPWWHFVRYGAHERRSPDRGVSSAEVLRQSMNPYARERFDKGYVRGQRRVLNNILGSQPSPNLLVFFNVATHLLSGGMLSINRFADLARDLMATDPDTAVLVSTVPLMRPTFPYELFTSSIEPVHFAVIANQTAPKRVVLFIPEHYVIDFVRALNDAERAWLAGRVIEVVVLDQNNLMMPDPGPLVHALGEISLSVTIATAHGSYTTQDLADRFSYPVKRLTPLLPELDVRSLTEKHPVIMVSPDIPAGDDGTLRLQFLKELGLLLPDFEIITVEDLTLAEYLQLASSCALSITFGEGLDGYFIEPVLAGGISFALANPAFFPASFEGCFSIALSLDDLRDRVVANWRKYQESPAAYGRDNEILRGLINGLYSRERTLGELASLLQGQVDFEPLPRVSSPQPFENLRVFLAAEHGFKFADPYGSTALAITPDNQVVEHFEGEFYSVLYEIYFARDYDALLRPSSRRTVLIDIGMNVGATSVYIASRSSSIEAIYGYEPIASVARVARRNIDRNIKNIPVLLKEIALSDRFGVEKAELIDGWTTAFSVDDPVLNAHLQVENNGRRHEAFTIEVEVVPASLEFAEIIAKNPSSRFIVKCDVQGSEFQIITDLAQAGLLEQLDTIVIESHFRSPEPIVTALEDAGFLVTSRLDSEVNQVHLIVAQRD